MYNFAVCACELDGAHVHVQSACYTFICVWVCVLPCAYAQLHVCLCIWLFVYMYAHMCVCVCVSVCVVCVCVRTCIRGCAYVCVRASVGECKGTCVRGCVYGAPAPKGRGSWHSWKSKCPRTLITRFWKIGHFRTFSNRGEWGVWRFWKMKVSADINFEWSLNCPPKSETNWSKSETNWITSETIWIATLCQTSSLYKWTAESEII